MGDSNMDFENAANLKEEDPPPLAMTSKDERCTNEEKIKIHIKENEVSVEVSKNARTFSFDSFDVSEENIDEYLEKLRQSKCNVSLKKIHFQGRKADSRTISETREYLQELGVKKIHSLKIDGRFSGWQEASFIKEFYIKTVDIGSGLPKKVLRSLLQSNLKGFSYHGPIKGKLLLDVDSSIPQIMLSSIQLSADVFTQILWKIQTGSLTKLFIGFDCIPWEDYTSVTSEDDENEPFPKERPLLIDTAKGMWFLHWDGAITFCKQRWEFKFVEISRRAPDDIPEMFKSVGKAIAKKFLKVESIRRHIISFFDTIPVASHEGAFPEERPLLCKASNKGRDSYYLLNEDGSLEIYSWRGSLSNYGHYDMDEESPELRIIHHAPLRKFVFSKIIEKQKMEKFDCKGVEEFRFLFEDFKPLPFDFRGQLPERRPLVFEANLLAKEYRNEDDDRRRWWDEEKHQEYRVVLYEDGTLIRYRCDLHKDKPTNENIGDASEDYDGVTASVDVQNCPLWYSPSVHITPENLKDILLCAPHKVFIYCIDLNVFRGAFEGMKTLPFDTAEKCPSDRPLVFEKTELFDGEVVDQRWLLLKDREVRKCEWNDGRAMISKGNRERMEEWPPALEKRITTVVDPMCKESVHEALAEKCEDEFRCHPPLFTTFFVGLRVLDASHEGPFPEERPLLCGSSRFRLFHRYYVLNEDGSIDFYSWEMATVRYKHYDMVKTWPDRIIAHTPLQKFVFDKRIKNCVKEGNFECKDMQEFRFLFEDYEKLPQDFRGQLPERYPLVFADSSLFEDLEDEDEENVDEEEEGDGYDEEEEGHACDEEEGECDDHDEEEGDDHEDEEEGDADCDEEEACGEEEEEVDDSDDDCTAEEEPKEDYRVVLYEDGTLIEYRCEKRLDYHVYINPCPTWHIPSILLTTENLREIILKAPLEEFTYCIDLDVFCDAFEGLKALPFYDSGDLPKERPLVFEKAERCGSGIVYHRCLLLKNKKMRKCVWKDGRATLSEGNEEEIDDIPPVLRFLER